jgi:hypothetical protein
MLLVRSRGFPSLQNVSYGFSYRSICCAERNMFHGTWNIQMSWMRKGMRKVHNLHCDIYLKLQDLPSIDCSNTLGVCLVWRGSLIFITKHPLFEDDRSFHLFPKLDIIGCSFCFVFLFSSILFYLFIYFFGRLIKNQIWQCQIFVATN